VERGSRRRNYTADEAIANAFEAVKAAAVGRLAEPVRLDAIALLDRTGAEGPFATQLHEMLEHAPAVPQAPPGRAVRLAAAIERRYVRWTEQPSFPVVVDGAFVVLGIGEVVSVVSLALDGPGIHTFPEHLTLGTSIVSATCYVIGAWIVRDDRADAYRWFERGVLMSIFVTQVFVFAEEQLAGVLGLAFHIAVWIMLRSAIKVERDQATLASAAPAPPPG